MPPLTHLPTHTLWAWQVPSEAPHYVHNLDSAPGQDGGGGGGSGEGVGLTVAVSSNFLDPSNLKCARRELTRMALTDARAEAILEALASPEFDASIDEGLARDVPWAQFKLGQAPTREGGAGDD